MASKLSLFLVELKRRKVTRVAVVYAVVGVGVIEVARLVFEALALPLIIWTVLATLILLGFPMALIMGQVLEVTPEEPLALAPAKWSPISWVLPGVGLAVALLAIYFLVFHRR